MSKDKKKPTTSPAEMSEHIAESISESIADPTLAELAAQEIGQTSSVGAVTVSVDWVSIISAKEDNLDADMLEIFYEEAAERFDEIDACISALAGDVSNKKQTNTLKRAVHTLKGSANTTGARKVGALFHYLEDLMDANGTLDDALLQTIQAGVDASFAAVDAMKENKSVDRAVARLVLNKSDVAATTTGAAGSAVTETHSSTHTSNETVTETTAESGANTDPETSQQIAAETGTVQPSVLLEMAAGEQKARSAKKSAKDDEDVLRVSTRILDTMVRLVGEVNIARSRIGMNIDTSKMAIAGLNVSMGRLSGLLRQIELEAEKQMFTGNSVTKTDSEFDALQMDRFTALQELTRRVAEAQNDVSIQQSTIHYAVRDMEDAVASQHVMVGTLASNLDQIRQVRVSSIVPLLKRVVRAACRDTGKQGEIFFDADVEIDRGILDKVGAALEHILRNAVAHGLESPSDREAIGKHAVGTIEFRAYQDGGDVVIEVRDDGRGINPQGVFASAVRKGLISSDAKMTDEQIRELIFEPGFSTAEEVTDIAGRGVGLDVVRSDIASMGGRVQLDSVIGGGTTFILRVPATLTVISGSAVKTNDHMYIVPVAFVNQLVRVSGQELATAYKDRKLVVKEANGDLVEYEFWGMWEIVGASSNETTPAARNSVLLMNGDRIAVHVDDIRPADDFVFRPMGPQISASTGLIGSTINASGNASLVVDPTRVARIMRMARVTGKQTAPEQEKKVPLVLIVDDSLTVRTVTSRLLKKRGLRVSMAENGMQALERINEERPDCILMDIEMPVMNGYDATQAIRADSKISDIPIIMITSRAGDSHRTRAFELGVNAYLGKPYNDNDLLQQVAKLTGHDELLTA